MKRKWYEWILTIAFFAMAALCVVWDRNEGFVTLAINGALFLIVAVIFLTADLGSFAPMNSIIRDLKKASEKIRSDAMNSHSYLWEPYSSSDVKLFKNSKLDQLFTDFVFELNREDNAEKAYYRPSIDDYINMDIVDTTMHRNELNQVPGMLTGLGILGTFIGLSIGLHNFNATGSTMEMTKGIEGLMDGIKVAFHTSIFGLVFSLVFNAVYKRKLFEAENAVSEFSHAFKKFVLPDTENNGMNQLIALSGEQIRAMESMYDRMAIELDRIVQPQFDRLSRTVAEYETIMVRNETEAINQIVESFVAQMNVALGDSFRKLGELVDEQYRSQKETADQMTELLNTTGSNTANLHSINNETQRLISTLNSYTASIQTIQNELQRTLANLGTEDKSARELIVQEKNMLLEQGNIIMELRQAIRQMRDYSKDTNEHVDEALEEIRNGVDYMRKLGDKKTGSAGRD